MVVQGIIALALALPTGMLFGVGYGTGVRVGYEQVYPLLFPAQQTTGRPDPKQTRENIKSINQIYDAIGGKEASQMGIAKGLEGAMSELDTNPDFRDLMELELNASGNTLSSSRARDKSPEPTSSQEGFLSDTERASALKQLEINRKQTILENEQFKKRNKLDSSGTIIPPKPSGFKLITPDQKLIGRKLLLHFKVKDVRSNGQEFIRGDAAFGDRTWHIRNIKKWKREATHSPTQYKKNRIIGYQIALIKQYGTSILKLL